MTRLTVWQLRVMNLSTPAQVDIYCVMIYILINGDSADVFAVWACAEMFQLLHGGELYAVSKLAHSFDQLN